MSNKEEIEAIEELVERALLFEEDNNSIVLDVIREIFDNNIIKLKYQYIIRRMLIEGKTKEELASYLNLTPAHIRSQYLFGLTQILWELRERCFQKEWIEYLQKS